MIDTIRLEVKGITGPDMERIKSSLESHLVVDNQSGQVKSELTRGSLVGSWDSRISVQIRDFEWLVYESEARKNIGKLCIKDQHNSKKTPVQVKCDEFIVIEFSLPKWFEGVNFINSSISEDLRRLDSFKHWFDRTLNIKTPNLDEWTVKRLDVAFCYQLGNYNNIIRYLQAFRNLDFPRRKKPQFYQDSFFCAGSTTTIKGYCKETEFKAHDYKRFYQYTNDRILSNAVMDLTKGLFRFEVEFKPRKLETLEVITVEDIEKIDWENEMKKEFYKLIKGGKTGKVFKYTEVLETLKEAEIKGKGISVESCASIWSTIVLEGDKYAKKHYGKMKVSRALKVFDQLGISVLGLIKETKVPPILTEVNLQLHDAANGKDIRKNYTRLFRQAA